VQHALRAFTPDDEKALRATVRTFPKSEYYKLEELLPQLGTGEAVVTILSEGGVPTPVVHTKMQAPRSRMGPADDIAAASAQSPLASKYATRIDSQSARELLAARLETATATPPVVKAKHRDAAKATQGGTDALGDFLGSRQGKALQREVVRGVFGLLRKRL
jgi:hypothetical protein